MSSIFRAYDVRGVYGKDITEEMMELIGNSLARFLREDRVVVARDPRASGESLAKSFIKGFTMAGKNATDIGMLPLGAGMFYAWKRGIPYAYVTASHLPKEWNGVKFFHKDAIGFLEPDNNRIRDLFLEGKLLGRGNGKIEKKDAKDVLDEYVEFMISRIKPERELRIVLDCGNGAAGVAAGEMFKKAGFSVDVVFGEPDGRFPNRSPDNFEDPLTEARRRSKKADLGVAYDGDGDRAVIIDNEGDTLNPEQTSYILLEHLLQRERGPVVANVECTKAIDVIADKFGRDVRRVRVGHTFLMDGVKRFGASFGVETSGHYVIPSLFPADDSLAVSYYFACVLSEKKGKLSDIVSSVPSYPFQRINFDCGDDKKFRVIDEMKARARREHRKVNTMDGVRVDLENGWALVRASNTSPAIRLTVEGKSREDLERIKKMFSDMLMESMDSVGQ